MKSYIREVMGGDVLDMPASTVCITWSSDNHNTKPYQVQKHILENTHDTFTIVWCHTPSSPLCSKLTTVLAGIVQRFNHPRMVISRVELSIFSKIADDIGNESIAPTSSQLPTVIAGEEGRSHSRYWRPGKSIEALIFCVHKEWSDQRAQVKNFVWFCGEMGGVGAETEEGIEN